jgi:hypothetical protein
MWEMELYLISFLTLDPRLGRVIGSGYGLNSSLHGLQIRFELLDDEVIPLPGFESRQFIEL